MQIISANLEKPNSFKMVAHIEGEAVVYARGNDQKVTDSRVATDPAFSRVFCT
jgi:hypothetical protein